MQDSQHTIPLRALVIEDSEDDTKLLVRELRHGGYDVNYHRVDTRETMKAALVQHGWDIVFADFTMPAFSAFEALTLIQQYDVDLPFIIVSGTIGEDRAVTAMKAGAHDYILKGSYKRLIPAVERELREALMRRERREAEKRLRFMAYNDPLTELPNRVRFQELLQQALANRRQDECVTALVMDLERFRDVNVTLGHALGDALLQQIGSRIRHALTAGDTVARLGGDEFAVLLSRPAGETEAKMTARKILNSFALPFNVEDIPVSVEANIGVAVAPTHGTDADTLFRHAETAMYTAKRLGSGYVTYLPADDESNPRHIALMAELRQAIQGNQLVLHYQPQIELRTGRVTAVEALVRWQHPVDGLVPPKEFVEPAERTGLIKPLTYWTLKEALTRAHPWIGQGLIPRVAVNLSARVLLDPTLPERVSELLANSKVSPGWLELEITESAIVVDPKRAIDTLVRLNRLGVALTVDDFGTGYTSISHLNQLPVESIKIDKSFVLGMDRDESNITIVRSIIDLGHNLGLKVVAEGVETQETLERLGKMGCDIAQGYHIGKPMPDEQFKAWVAQYRPAAE